MLATVVPLFCPNKRARYPTGFIPFLANGVYPTSALVIIEKQGETVLFSSSAKIFSASPRVSSQFCSLLLSCHRSNLLSPFVFSSIFWMIINEMVNVVCQRCSVS